MQFNSEFEKFRRLSTRRYFVGQRIKIDDKEKKRFATRPQPFNTAQMMNVLTRNKEVFTTRRPLNYNGNQYGITGIIPGIHQHYNP